MGSQVNGLINEFSSHGETDTGSVDLTGVKSVEPASMLVPYFSRAKINACIVEDTWEVVHRH